MNTIKTKTALIITALVVAPFASNLVVTPSTASAANYCTSERCKAAVAAEQVAAAKAAEATATANTLENEVARLENDIASIQAHIVANQAIADDLTLSIAHNEQVLAEEQAALAEMLVDSYLDGELTTAQVMFSANSVSDFNERKSRQDTVKNQVNLSAEAVKTLKLELDKQKQEVERIIVDQQAQRLAVSNLKTEQQNLLEQYRNNAEAYTAEAEEARRVQSQEIASEIAKYNSSGVVASGTDTYPYRGRCPQDNLRFSAYGGYGCQCTSYAGWKAYERWGVSIYSWGNANTWGYSAENLGYLVDYNPAAYTIAVNESGIYGHVMWVESVNANGTINVSEYNWSYGVYTMRYNVSPIGLRFIHFN